MGFVQAFRGDVMDIQRLVERGLVRQPYYWAYNDRRPCRVPLHDVDEHLRKHGSVLVIHLRPKFAVEADEAGYHLYPMWSPEVTHDACAGWLVGE